MNTRLEVSLFAFLVLQLLIGCTTLPESNENCDFSSDTSEPERCFGGVGDRCRGASIFVPMKLDYKACTVDGYMSLGSIMHDKCCISTYNLGYKCAFAEENTENCKDEYQKAVKDSICSILGSTRQWSVTFGPYSNPNNGDCLDDCLEKAFLAPSGMRVAKEYTSFCKNGCTTDIHGNVIYENDWCGEYCSCK